MTYPFSEHAESTGERSDEELVNAANEGDRRALDTLVSRHQPWIYNLALRMLHSREDAADATQEILVKATVRLTTFAGRSCFSTWLYRIATNHLLNERRLHHSLTGVTFESFEAELDRMPDSDVPESDVPGELLVQESLIACTSAMLLCLSPEQRISYILGEVFGASDRVASEVLAISRSTFRKRLERARRDLHAFMDGQCGLVDPRNPCRCAKKTRAFIDEGHIDPRNMVFAGDRLTKVQDAVPETVRRLDSANRRYARIYREHNLAEPPDDFASSLQRLLDSQVLKDLEDGRVAD